MNTVADRLSTEDLDRLVLQHGSHSNRSAGVCFMEAAAWFAGRPHTDRPECVSPVLGAFGRAFNDGLPDDESRTRLMKPYIPRVVGTRADPDVEIRRAFLAMDWIVREYTPAWLDLKPELREHAATLRALSPIKTTEDLVAAQPQLDAARRAAAAARDAAWAAARDAARDAAWDAAWAAARAAARDAAWAAARDAAWDAAWAAAWAAAWDAAWAAARAAARDAAWDAAWAAARAAARDAAYKVSYAAAFAIFKPVVERLQVSAMQLFERMIDVVKDAA